jgi:murein DD-endopeptidase MepM/ murein hydrolase activator NlpD
MPRARRNRAQSQPAFDQAKCLRDQKECRAQQPVSGVAGHIKQDGGTGQKGEMLPFGKPCQERVHHAATDGGQNRQNEGVRPLCRCDGDISAAVPRIAASRRRGTTLLPTFCLSLGTADAGLRLASFPRTLVPEDLHGMPDQQAFGAQPTFEQTRPAASAGRHWPKVGMCFGSLALVAALCLMAWPEKEVPQRLAGEVDLQPESGTPMPQMAASEEPMPEFAAVLPDPEPTDPAPPDFSSPAASPSVEASIQLKKGDTIARVLDRLGVTATDVAEIVAVLAEHVRMDRLSIGQALTVKLQPPDDDAAAAVVVGLSIRPEPQREFTIERGDDGDYSVEEEVFAVTPRLGRASGTVDGSVIAAAAAAGVPHGPLAEMLRAFSWDVNFQHDIKVGDRFDVLIERAWTSDGQPVDGGRVLWAEITTGGGAESYSIYRFKPRDGDEFFYNGEGESVVKSLLRTPLNMSRISSRFGLRRHPVLRFTRLHAGVDFAAPPGTPILAAGAGHVIEAGVKGGYGKWVKIAHEGNLATGYAHMSRIAPGVKRSARVRQGQVIGYVGTTGLSTGPHLHFELHRGGRPVDPLSMARTAQRARLAGQDLKRFKAQIVETDRARETAATIESKESLEGSE